MRERYWHFSNTDTNTLSKNDVNATLGFVSTCIVPDGLVWRKYLKLLILITERCKRNASCSFVLLESAAECMDYRNSSPSVGSPLHLRKESAAIQERSRLKKLVQRKQIHVFCDLSMREEEWDEWDLLRYSEMTTEDRCKHSILRANKLLDSKRVLLVVEHTKEIKSISDGTTEIMSMAELIEFLVQHEMVEVNSLHELTETMKRCEIDYQRRNHHTDDDENFGGSSVSLYLSEEAIAIGLRNGSLHKGRFEVTKQNAREGYVSTPKERYFLSQEAFHFNRAIHHDLVIIQPLPESQWECPVGQRRLIHHRDDEENDISDPVGPVFPTARVVAIAETSRRLYVATLVDSPADDETVVVVIPMDTRIPRVRIRTAGWQRFVNQRLLVEIDGWDVDSHYPNGHCVEVLGAIGDLETEMSCLLYEHEIRLEPFSVAATACLPAQGIEWSVTPEEVARRRDLRSSRRIFSVDPPGCQDIDDAMHAEVLLNGDVEVGVHIADVTHFVPHNSALDLEAQVRGTTFYLVDRRFDMLPSLLSGNLCSLHGNMDRLAVSVIWTMSPDFQTIKSVWYGRTVIHNCQAMTYEQAHNILHDVSPDDPSKTMGVPPLTAGAPIDRKLIPNLKRDLGILTHLSRKLRMKREELGGAVDLSSGDFGTELKFSLDDTGNPFRVSSKQELEIHHTIAEMMIMANQSVAEKIFAAFPDSSLLRIHPTVNEDRFEDLQSALKAGGIHFDGSSNMALAQSLKQAKLEGKNAAIVNSLWQSLATRAMSEALYVCTGSQGRGAGLSHYGLGIHKYTHFTSPIRRYADIVVHKQLIASLILEKKSKSYLKHPPGFPMQNRLESIPTSMAVSIEKGEGLKTRDHNKSDKLVASLVNRASELSLVTNENRKFSKNLSTPDESNILKVYESTEVSSICDLLNKQNRMAKRSSFECQRLFLSLYFRTHAEIVPAVITDLRVNGLLVYVPKFDLKGPVFLSDINGNIQIDPGLVGLSSNAGLDPTLGFAPSGVSRLLPAATCVMHDNDDEVKRSLQILVPGAPKTLNFRALDIVMVHISCDLSDTKARVPPPRLHLVAKTERPGRSTKALARSLAMLDNNEKNRVTSAPDSDHEVLADPKTLFSVLAAVEIVPCLESAMLRCSKPKRKGKSSNRSITVGGRRVFGEFVNPETRAAQQEAAVAAASESASQRRAIVQATVARRTEYDQQQNAERSLTARTQKLAAFKRSARRGN